MRVEPARVGSVVIDSLPFSQGGTMGQAVALRAAGVAAVAGYLGVVNETRLGLILAAGMAYIPVTLAGEYNDGPNDEVGQLHALGIPEGASVFLDLEGLAAFKSDPVTLAMKIDAWGEGIHANGWIPKLYVGVPQPFTSAELYARHVFGYWKGQGSVRDRNNALAEPWGDAAHHAGWMITQMFPSLNVGDPATWVDMNMIGADYKGRVPQWVVAD